MKIYLDDKEIEVKDNLRFIDLSRLLYDEKEKIGVIVNNSFKNLQEKVKEGDRVEFIGKCVSDADGITERTLTLILILACKNLYKDRTIKVEHSISNYVYCEFMDNYKVLHTEIANIRNEMTRIINEDYQILRKKDSKEKVLKLFKKEGYKDKILLFENLDIEEISYYEVDGRIFTFHGYLAPSTGYIDDFNIISYYPGIAINSLNSCCPKEVKDFVEEKSLSKIFSTSKKWTELLGIKNVGDLNESIINNDIKYLIDVSEAYFENQVSDIANKIVMDNDIDFVQIAGPSSSGKTTLAYRLTIQLGARGKRPIIISTDDYFVNREDTPLNENGEKDYEMLESIDLVKLNHDLMLLLEGKEVELPKYNFYTGKRENSGKFISLKEDDIIIIEGLHCLNPKLTALVPEKNKFKVYISALTQLNIDNHNRIATTRVRLLRRIIRDSKFRGVSLDETLCNWNKVRNGEEKYIFPYQDLAEEAIDSSLIYELSILKKYAYELFDNYDKNGNNYKDIKKLKSFLKYFKDIENESLIPNNSILREMIG